MAIAQSVRIYTFVPVKPRWVEIPGFVSPRGIFLVHKRIASVNGTRVGLAARWRITTREGKGSLHVDFKTSDDAMEFAAVLEGVPGAEALWKNYAKAQDVHDRQPDTDRGEEKAFRTMEPFARVQLGVLDRPDWFARHQAKAASFYQERTWRHRLRHVDQPVPLTAPKPTRRRAR